jgi:hypothetical protein
MKYISCILEQARAEKASIFPPEPVTDRKEMVK